MKRSLWLVLGAAAAVGFYTMWRARSGDSGGRAAGATGSTGGPRIVILGAGFGGLSAARELRRRMGSAARITLVDRHNYHLFTPMLYEVAAWGLDPYDTAFAVREFATRRGVEFRRGMVTGIDIDRRRVHLDDDAHHEAQRDPLRYDYLVIGLGSATNFFGNKGAEKHSYPIKWLEDGVAISNQIIDRLERATLETDARVRRALLTFLIAGGGATGVETAAALQDMLSHELGKDYANLDPKEARVVVIEMADRLLGHMPAAMSEIALRRLRDMGVEVWLKSKVQDVTPDRVTLADGRVIETNTVLWTAGVRAPDVVAAMNVPHGNGGSIAVNRYLQVRGVENVYAIGDSAHFEDPDTHESTPLLAQAAIQQGAQAAENIARQARGEALLPFHYRPLGEALSLGRWNGEIQTGKVVVDGFIGWAGWRFIHLVRITSARDRLATLLDWGMGYFYSLDQARLDLRPSMPDASQAMQHA